MKRSTEACTIFRSRKVRCDVVERLPCSNCKWHGVRCTISENRRRKKQKIPEQKAPQQHEDVSLQSESCNDLPSFNHTGDRSSSLFSSETNVSLRLESPLERESVTGKSTINQSLCASGNIEQSSEYPTPRSILHNVAINTVSCTSSSQFTEAGQPADTSEIDSLAGIQTNSFDNGPSDCGTSCPPAFDANSLSSFETLTSTSHSQNFEATIRLPTLIKWPPTKSPMADVIFLYEKDVLTLPSASLQCALLQAYVTFVHPQFPVIDLPDFLHKITSKEESAEKLSLLLYYAVLFASAPYIDFYTFQEAGFASKAAACESFGNKIRLLHDFDYEDDPLVQIQAMLLQAHVKDTVDDHRDHWHLTGVAISLALSVGLHRSPQGSTQSSGKQRFLRRLWWMCFLSDHLLAVLAGRPTRILPEDHDMPRLDENDFDLGPFPVDGYIITSDTHPELSTDTIRKHATLCITKVDLFLSIFQASKAQYTTLLHHPARPQIGGIEDTGHLKRQVDDLQSLLIADLPLLKWFVESRPFGLCQELSGSDVDRAQEHVALQAIFSQMIYFSAYRALQMSLCQRASRWPQSDVVESVQELLQIKAWDAASQIGRLAAELCRSDHARYLPVHVVKLVASAAVDLGQDSNRTRRHRNGNDIQGAQNCVTLLRKLSGVYQAADKALEGLYAKLGGNYGLEEIFECSKSDVTATLPKDWALSPGECLNEHATTPITFQYPDLESSEIQSLDPLASLSGELLNPITFGDEDYSCPEFEILFDS